MCCFSIKGLHGKIPLKNCKDAIWQKFKCLQGKPFLKSKCLHKVVLYSPKA